MRKLAVLSFICSVTAILNGCAMISQGRTEIDKIFITRIISIDEAKEGRIMVTLTTKSISTGGGGQQQKETSENIASIGTTIADAHKNLLVHADKRPSFGHTEYILFGEAIAKKGIKPYLDYISRYNEFRYNSKIYIVKGDTANSLVRKSSTAKLFVGDRISRSEENAVLTSLSIPITLNEALLILDNQNLDVFIPSAEMSITTGMGENATTHDIMLNGYGVFNKDKLSYFTSTEEARGINWMLNRIGSGLILVKNDLGEKVSLNIIKGQTKIKPRIMGNELHCDVNATFTTNISEIMGDKTVLDINSINQLTALQNKAIKKEIENTIAIAQRNDSDHFSVVSKFIIKYPMMKDYLRENWSKLFPYIRFNVTVNSNIKGTYMINEPSGSTRKIRGE